MDEQKVYDLVEYVKACGNQSFSEKGFNTADGLVLAELSYIDWSSLNIPYPGDGTMTLAEAISNLPSEVMAGAEDWFYQLLQAIIKSERFGSMVVSNFYETRESIDQVDTHTELEQFAAITFTYTDENGEPCNYVSFRGTDNTMHGWCEDFNMAYDPMTEAQRRSMEYLRNIAEHLEGGIRLGGHSKGGNNAMYAFLFSDEAIRDRIIKIYIYDAPGFIRDEISFVDDAGNRHPAGDQVWQRMIELLQGSAICPYDSVIGQLLNEMEFLFVDTDGVILLDHDAFLWHMDPNTGEFIPREQSRLSKYINELTDEWIGKLPVEYREAFMKTIWHWLYSLNVDKFGDLGGQIGNNLKESAVSFMNYLSSLPQEEHELFTKALSMLILLALDNCLEEVLPGYETVRRKVDRVLQERNITTAEQLWLYLKADPLNNTMELLQSILDDWDTVKALASCTAAVMVVTKILSAALFLLKLAASFVIGHLAPIAAIIAAVVVVSMAIDYIREHWDELVAFVNMVVDVAREKLAEFVAGMKLAITAGAHIVITQLVATATKITEEVIEIGSAVVSVVQELGRVVSGVIAQSIAISNPLLYTLCRVVAGITQSMVTIDMALLQDAVDDMDALATRVQNMDTRLDRLYRQLCISNIQQGEGIFTSLANLYNLSSADILVDQGNWIRRKANDLSSLFDGYRNAEHWALNEI